MITVCYVVTGLNLLNSKKLEVLSEYKLWQTGPFIGIYAQCYELIYFVFYVIPSISVPVILRPVFKRAVKASTYSWSPEVRAGFEV